MKITDKDDADMGEVPKMLMNPCTGSVDTEENWLAEMKDWETSTGQTQQEQFDSLIEVVQDAEGNWVPA